jgi:hypothetical protein
LQMLAGRARRRGAEGADGRGDTRTARNTRNGAGLQFRKIANRLRSKVAKTGVVLYREVDGSCPFVAWFDELPATVQDKCYLRLERLREMGRELRRPEADFLRDGNLRSAGRPSGSPLPDPVLFPRGDGSGGRTAS